MLAIVLNLFTVGASIQIIKPPGGFGPFNILILLGIITATMFLALVILMGLREEHRKLLRL